MCPVDCNIQPRREPDVHQRSNGGNSHYWYDNQTLCSGNENIPQASTFLRKVCIDEETTWEVPSRLKFIKKIGSGAYGCVASFEEIKTTDKDGNVTNGRVAVKKIGDVFRDLVDAKRIFREIKILKALKHDNLINLIEIFDPQTPDFEDIYLVSDLMDTDLHRVIYSRQPLTPEHHQYFLYQILLAIAFLHEADVIHRDLKPSNVLVNLNCDVKLCDFGLARGLHGTGVRQRQQERKQSVVKKMEYTKQCTRTEKNFGNDIDPGNCVQNKSNEGCRLRQLKREQQHAESLNANNGSLHVERMIIDGGIEGGELEDLELTEYVVTRWYRPPELLLYPFHYSKPVDLWSAGCIFAELLGRRALFAGKDPFDQLRRIVKICGTPSEADVAFLLENQETQGAPSRSKRRMALNRQFLDKLPKTTGVGFSSLFPDASALALDLLSKLLAFNPARRLTAIQALRHPYFDGLYSKEDEPIGVEPMDWGFDSFELKKRNLQNLIYREIVSYHPHIVLRDIPLFSSRGISLSQLLPPIPPDAPRAPQVQDYQPAPEEVIVHGCSSTCSSPGDRYIPRSPINVSSTASFLALPVSAQQSMENSAYKKQGIPRVQSDASAPRIPVCQLPTSPSSAHILGQQVVSCFQQHLLRHQATLRVSEAGEVNGVQRKAVTASAPSIWSASYPSYQTWANHGQPTKQQVSDSNYIMNTRHYALSSTAAGSRKSVGPSSGAFSGIMSSEDQAEAIQHTNPVVPLHATAPSFIGICEQVESKASSVDASICSPTSNINVDSTNLCKRGSASMCALPGTKLGPQTNFSEGRMLRQPYSHFRFQNERYMMNSQIQNNVPFPVNIPGISQMCPRYVGGMNAGVQRPACGENIIPTPDSESIRELTNGSNCPMSIKNGIAIKMDFDGNARLNGAHTTLTSAGSAGSRLSSTADSCFACHSGISTSLPLIGNSRHTSQASTDDEGFPSSASADQWTHLQRLLLQQQAQQMLQRQIQSQYVPLQQHHMTNDAIGVGRCTMHNIGMEQQQPPDVPLRPYSSEP